MSKSLRRVLAGSAAAAALLTATMASAAPPADDAAPPGAVAASAPGKGDSDGDRIADDLEAALARLAPGERVAVIVQGTTPADARRAAPSLALDHEYTIIPAFSGSVTAGQVTALSRIPGVTRVELDGVATALDASGELDYGVVAARSAFTPTDGTLDGDGVSICIIDTGLDPAHEQFTGGRVIAWKDWVNGRTAPYDDHGHGTHVAGIAAGDGVGTSAAVTAGGVARAADLAIAKVLSSAGSGSDSDVAAAIEWCADLGSDVISMSLGSPGGDGSDAGSQAVDAATALGSVVVVAAGNSGDAPGTISSPGVATGAITVGAGSDASTLAGSSDTDAGFYLAGFSGRGPTTNPGAPLKPDVVGPGLSVVAARAGTTTGYVTYSGTSMATPFVAGVVALGLEAVPGANPGAVKAALHASALDAGATGADDEWGHGLVDARAFVAELGATASSDEVTPWPGHTTVTGSVGSGAVAEYPIEVTTAGLPLGVTLETTNGAATCLLPVGGSCWWGYEWAPDLDAYLVNPSGTVVAMSRCMLEATNGNCAAPGRFETLGIASAAAGTWKLRVESFSGSGTFLAEVFGGLGGSTPPPPPPPPPPPEEEETPPAAPSDLTGTALSPTSIWLTWTDNAHNETGFAVERCAGRRCTWTELSRVDPSEGPGPVTFTDDTVARGTTYQYRVFATNEYGDSDYSNTVSIRTPKK